jgi:hypothetical protein
MRSLKVLTGSLVMALLLSLAAVPVPLSADPAADFDHDHWSDLAIGVPYENISSYIDAGTVTVLYGSTPGLSGTGDEYWRQNILSGSDSESHDRFGIALTVGDFDGDRFYDLAVGVSYEDVGPVENAGAVNVIYGSAVGGLDAAGNQYWNQNESGMLGSAENGDHFGAALASGDFDGDGYHDLAIGVPSEDIGSLTDSGAVQVMYGTGGGLTAVGDEIWDQEGGEEAGDRYGDALAVGDFDGDGYDDLAVGIPSEDLGSVVNAGAVQILYGSSTGLRKRTRFNDFWHQDRSSVADTASAHDLWGSALTTGDFDGDGYDDLAVGIPHEDVGSPTVPNAGAVNVLYGSDTGIISAGSDYWHQDSPGVGSYTESDDRFGYSLVAADFDSNGYSDLAVGVPYEHWDYDDTGIVQILRGGPGGLSGVGSQIWRQDSAGIEGGEELGDRFGYALAASDFDGDRFLDLAIGVPYEAIGSTNQAGAVNVIFGSHAGLTSSGDQIWYQGYNGVQGTPESGDRFGHALAALPRLTIRVTLPVVMRNH